MRVKIIQSPFVIICLSSLFAISAFVFGCQHTNKMDREIQQIINKYLDEHRQDELITGISVSISLSPKAAAQNYVVGKVSNHPDASPITPHTLFQIGSITKSFASAIVLQLEAEGKLNIHQTVGNWLPQYPKWKNVTLKSLLNMTSGIPDYIEMQSVLAQISQNIEKQWTNQEIVNIVYSTPNQTKGFNYSNTNYILLAMIIEKVTNHTFTDEVEKRLLDKEDLTETFYADGPYSTQVLDKMSNGYFYGKHILKKLYGKDMLKTNLSVAGAAGAAVATPEDVIYWVRALFGAKLFPAKQLEELTEIVSMKSGRPIKETSASDPMGFGLGVAQAHTPGIGRYWFYEGTTIGYRVMYLWNPCNNIIVSVGLNSSPLENGKDPDKINVLLIDIYKKIISEQPQQAGVCGEMPKIA